MDAADAPLDWRNDENLVDLLDQFLISCRKRRQLDVELRIWLAAKIREQWRLGDKAEQRPPAMKPEPTAAPPVIGPRDPGDELLLGHEVAPMLRVTYKTLANWRSIGRGPRFMKHGKSIRYRRADVEEFINCASG